MEGDNSNAAINVEYGGYRIRKLNSKKVWIESPEGEGMEIEQRLFADALDKLFADQF